MLLTCSITPNVQPRQIHHAAPKRILMVPGGLASTFHILQDTLEKVVAQEVIEGTQIPVPNVAQFEDLACNVVVARNEGDDDMATLLRHTVRKETVNK